MTDDHRPRCMDCAHWSPKKVSPELARLGFGHCAPRSISNWHTFSGTFKRLCEHFKRAPEETIEAREQFAAAQQPTTQEKAST